MAHANPEYALALRAWKEPPEAHKLAPGASLRDLRARVRGIELRIETDPGSVSAREYEILHAWRRVTRQARERGPDLASAISDMARPRRQPEPHVTEPVRRYPHNVQAGRVTGPLDALTRR